MHFFSLSFLWNSLWSIAVSSLKVWYNSAVYLSSPGLFFVGKFLITASALHRSGKIQQFVYPVLDFPLLRDSLLLLQSHSWCLVCFLFILSWFNFGRSYVSRDLSISFTFYNFLDYTFSKYSIMILWISVIFVIISAFSLLILLTWFFSLTFA
jgi:hypothetical protein